MLDYAGKYLEIDSTILKSSINFHREMWDTFFLLRMHTGIGYFLGTALIFLTELDYIRDDRHVNIAVSALLQFSYILAGSFFAWEAVAIFM